MAIPRKTISRRNFFGGLAAASAAFAILPQGLVAGTNTRKPRKLKPGDRMNIAAVGIGGMGKSNLRALESENIAALCDVDDAIAEKVYAAYPKAKTYRDFRILLEKEKYIDGVVVATPDHTHAVVAMAAMQLGKHVYVQKPLTRLVSEARALTEAARRYGVVTQMGNQGHSGEPIRMLCEMIWTGAIGPVHEIHTWTNRPIWPQGVPTRPPGAVCPPALDWDLWLGPSPVRDFDPAYHPFAWRGWWDFGSGALGDMGCHIIDLPFMAMKLKYPVSVEARVSDIVGPAPKWNKMQNRETFPDASIVHYQFPARGDMPPVKLIWYDGGLMPPTPDELEPGRKLPNGGLLIVGEKGKILSGGTDDGPRLIPESAMQAYARPAKTLPRIEGSHEMNWVQACKGGPSPTAAFDYAGPLTETIVMGNLAVAFPGQKLEWDGENMRVTNLAEANDFVQMHYREGWSL
jgi:predicted dehydrogenase